jgi:hypothetical protein
LIPSACFTGTLSLPVSSSDGGETSKKPRSYELWVAIAISLFAALAFYFSTNPTLHDLDYTAEIASAFLRGDLGPSRNATRVAQRDDSVRG